MQERNEAYVALTCDGRAEMVECRGDSGNFAQSWHGSHYSYYDDLFQAWEIGKWPTPYDDSVVGKFVKVRLPGKSVLGRDGLVWWQAKAQPWFYGKSAYPLFNKTVWKILGELRLGTIVGEPMPIRRARKLLAAINAELDRLPDLPIPREVMIERYVPTGDPEFFDRCNRRGLLAPFDVVLQLARPDYLWFAQNCPFARRYVDEMRHEYFRDEWKKIDETPSTVFVRMNDYLCRDLKEPLNDGRIQSLCERKVNEWVRSGQAKVFVALRFDDAKKFELFELEEGASRGQNWEVVFEREEREDLEDGDPSDGCRDAVLVATSLPIPWVDKTPWCLESVRGVNGGAK